MEPTRFSKIFQNDLEEKIAKVFKVDTVDRSPFDYKLHFDAPSGQGALLNSLWQGRRRDTSGCYHVPSHPNIMRYSKNLK